MLNLTRYPAGQLRRIQDGCLMDVFTLCNDAADISRKMIEVPAAQGELYNRLHQQWQVKIAEAQRRADLIPKITAELERRAQAGETAPCASTAPATGRECALPAGHPGQHQSGMVVWGAAS